MSRPVSAWRDSEAFVQRRKPRLCLHHVDGGRSEVVVVFVAVSSGTTNGAEWLIP